MATNPNFGVSPSDGGQVPLQTWQRARLIMDCLPLVGFDALVLVVFILFRDLIGSASPLLVVFVVVVIGVLGFQSLGRIRDLMSGLALVREDVLTISHPSRASGRMFFGSFKELGRMRLMPKAHFGTSNGMRCRVTYSPISRIVWTLDKLD